MKIPCICWGFFGNLVKNIHEHTGVNVIVEVLNFYPESLLEWHRELTKEAATGHTEVPRSEIGDLTQTIPEEIPDRALDSRVFAAIPIYS